MAIVNGVEVLNGDGEIEVCEALHISESRTYAVIQHVYEGEFRVVSVSLYGLVPIDRPALGLAPSQGLSWEQALAQIASLEGKT